MLTRTAGRILLPSLLALGAALAARPIAAQDVRVTAGSVEDSRTTGRFFAGLEVELNLVGDGLDGTKAARVLVKKAVDDAGTDLMPDEKKDPEFQESFGGGPPRLKLKLKNPARKASAVREISGDLQLFVPGRDPASTVQVEKFLSKPDKTVSAPGLKAASVEVKLLSFKGYQAQAKKSEAEMDKEMEKHKAEMQKEAAERGMDPKEVEAMIALVKGLSSLMGDAGENDVILEIKDKEKRLLDIQVIGKNGEKISSQGSVSSGGIKVLKYQEKIPSDAAIRFTLLTKKALVTVPLALKDVPLP